MDLQTGLLSVIGFLSTGLSAVCKILWDRSLLCEKERREMQLRLDQLQTDYGRAKGRLDTIEEFEKLKTERIKLP